MAESTTDRSASATLMGALEEVEDAQDCLIIFVNKDGSISWHTTTTADHRKLGMVEFVAAVIKGRIAREGIGNA
jgi:hypothetical protein